MHIIHIYSFCRQRLPLACIVIFGLLQARMLVSGNNPGYWITTVDILGIIMLFSPAIFIGIYQAGIQSNISYLPGAGDIRFLPFMTLVAAIVYLARRWIQLPRLVPNGIILLQVTLWGLFAYGITYSDEPRHGLDFLWRFAYYHTFLCVLPLVFHDDMVNLRRIVYAYGMTSVLVGLSTVSAYDKVLNRHVDYLWLVIYADERIISAGMLFVVWLLVQPKKLGIWRLPLFMICFILSVSLVLLNRRGILLATMLAIGLCIFLNNRLSLKGIIILALLISTIMFILQIVPEHYRNKLFNPNEYLGEYTSTQIRIRIYDNTLARIKQSPMWGYGTGSGSSEGLLSGLTPFVHNIFLEIAYQLGIVGVVIFSFFLLSIALSVKRCLIDKIAEDERRSLGILVVCWFIVCFIYAQLSGDLLDNRSIWFFAGLIGALAQSPAAVWRAGQEPNDG